MDKLTKNAERVYTLLIAAAGHLQSPLLLFVRLYWGWQFFQTGWGKTMDIPRVTGFFTNLGIPLPGFNAHLVSVTECVGGILLFIGLGSRLIALPLAIDMAVAYIAADKEALLSFFSNPGKFYAADPYTFLFASLLVLIFGPGKMSLDYLVQRWLGRSVGVEMPHRRRSVIAAG
jgi:putative oxidoreductase